MQMRSSSEAKIGKTIVFMVIKKREIQPSRLYHKTFIISKKIIFSAGVSWEVKTKHYFINTNGVKVKSNNHIQLLDDNLLPDCRT